MTKQEQSGSSRDSLEQLLSVRSPPPRQSTQGGGIRPIDMLELPPDLRQVMTFLMREGLSTAREVAAPMRISVDKATDLLDTLVARGHARQTGQGEQSMYEPILGRSRRPRLSSRLWEILEEED